MLRRNPENECGTPVGQINVVVQGLPGVQTISFYCNRPRLHKGMCTFVGKEVTILANRDRIIRP